MKSKNAEIRRAVRQREQIEKQIRRLILEDIGQCRPRVVTDRDEYLSVVWKSNGTEFSVSEWRDLRAVATHYAIALNDIAQQKLFSRLLRLVNGGAQ